MGVFSLVITMWGKSNYLSLHKIFWFLDLFFSEKSSKKTEPFSLGFFGFTDIIGLSFSILYRYSLPHFWGYFFSKKFSTVECQANSLICQFDAKKWKKATFLAIFTIFTDFYDFEKLVFLMKIAKKHVFSLFVTFYQF